MDKFIKTVEVFDEKTCQSIIDLFGFLAMGGLLVSGGIFLNYLLSKGK